MKRGLISIGGELRVTVDSSLPLNNFNKGSSHSFNRGRLYKIHSVSFVYSNVDHINTDQKTDALVCSCIYMISSWIDREGKLTT